MYVSLYEFRHKERLSNDICTDLTKTKSFFNFLIKNDKESKFNEISSDDNILNDFIHYPSTDPFGFILISKYQVKKKLINLGKIRLIYT